MIEMMRWGRGSAAQWPRDAPTPAAAGQRTVTHVADCLEPPITHKEGDAVSTVKIRLRIAQGCGLQLVNSAVTLKHYLASTRVSKGRRRHEVHRLPPPTAAHAVRAALPQTNSKRKEDPPWQHILLVWR
jgi:hypothetical protein